ncbi:hypothetical protein CIB48_g8801 [Xylaria polymorpha]|nr:hypothetical protein CIB48_g8801 [Xylaria polymorpha]
MWQNNLISLMGPEVHQWEAFDGFQIGWDRIDPIAEKLLLTPVPGIQPYLHGESPIQYYNALKIMVAAFGAKDIRKPGFNFDFFATISREIGIEDTLAVSYLYELLIERRHMFHVHYTVTNRMSASAGRLGTSVRPYTALATVADELLILESVISDGEPGPSDSEALAAPGEYFAHTMVSKISEEMNKRILLKDALSEARLVAAREEMVFVAKSVAKTMIEMDMLKNFTNIKTILNTEEINGERLVKTVANAMVDADLLVVVPDLVKFLMQKLTKNVHHRIKEIAACINQGVVAQFYGRDEGKSLKAAIDDILLWDSNHGRSTFFHHLKVIAPLTGTGGGHGDTDGTLVANHADDSTSHREASPVADSGYVASGEDDGGGIDSR